MTPGPVLFARYAYPPNALGLCGTAETQLLLEYGAAGVSDAGLVELARTFEGAWPYLELIAAENGIGDPLDERVVEAYWIGNPLLDRIDERRFGRHLEERFRARAGPAWRRLAEAVPARAVPHHNFHVFGVYPWVGLLRTGASTEPLRVLESCRIAAGRVEHMGADVATVVLEPLVWDGRRLGLGGRTRREASWHTDGLGFVGELRPGDWVSVHWDWICDRLRPGEVARLRRYTLRTLALANQTAAASAVAG
jgi:Family of unknown function (DUF6390)